MSTQEIHVGDVGTVFRVTVYDGDDIVDLSESESLLLRFKKPSTETMDMEGDFYTDGTDGIVQYITQDGDLDQPGKWKIQAIVEFADTLWHSTISEFTVFRNLAEPVTEE